MVLLVETVTAGATVVRAAKAMVMMTKMTMVAVVMITLEMVEAMIMLKMRLLTAGKM